MNTSDAPIYPDLAGKVVFITGGGSGIGAAITFALAMQQARVAFVDISEESSRQLHETIARANGILPLFLPCDIRDTGALKKAIESAQQRLGDISVLVNNAGNDDRHGFEEVTPEYWDARIAVNLKPMFFAAQAVAPQMKRLGGGSIINLGSVIWRIKQTGLPVYNTCKAAITGLTRVLARELGPAGIRVNTLSPGATWTERQIKLWYTPELAKELLGLQCLKEKILPEDLANMAVFLASEASSKCTAQDFIVDAGLS